MGGCGDDTRGFPGDTEKHCRQCKHYGHDNEVDNEKSKGVEVKIKHFHYCGRVLDEYGIAKGIDVDTEACSEFVERKKGETKRGVRVDNSPRHGA